MGEDLDYTEEKFQIRLSKKKEGTEENEGVVRIGGLDMQGEMDMTGGMTI